MTHKVKHGNSIFLPMPVTLIGALINNKPSFMTASWIARISFDPPRIAVSMSQSHETVKGIRANKAFSICIPNRELLTETDYCGITSGKNASKSRVFDVFYGDLDAAPMISDCPCCMTCRLTSIIKENGSYLFIGEVDGTYIDDASLTEGKIDPSKIDPVILTMSDNSYWSLGSNLGAAWKLGAALRNQSLNFWNSTPERPSFGFGS
jgi:flavin reductase (DIM6/NTAB) family NADH-FMN oxidoreductase RutF